MSKIEFDFIYKEQMVYRGWSIHTFVKDNEVWCFIIDNAGNGHDFAYLHEALLWIDDLCKQPSNNPH